MTVTIDSVCFLLKEPHDFSWLEDYGTVFCAYDRQDSGNLLFGVEREGIRRFIKYAGAPTVEYDGTPEDAVNRLRAAAEVYRQLRHPLLVNMTAYREVPGGAIAVYDWFDGRGMHEHWTFDQVGKMHPDSPYYRYLHLPMEKRLKSLEDIFALLIHVEQSGYVPVDFYDGSILYDFERDITRICDIDCFRKTPTVNDLGAGLYGTTRLKAPEEYELGAALDSATTAFTLGALILHLFGQYSPREIRQINEERRFFPCPADRWSLDERRYAVVRKAVEPDRHRRYRSVAAFHRAWAG